jgi:hypothetical protein
MVLILMAACGAGKVTVVPVPPAECNAVVQLDTDCETDSLVVGELTLDGDSVKGDCALGPSVEGTLIQFTMASPVQPGEYLCKLDGCPQVGLKLDREAGSTVMRGSWWTPSERDASGAFSIEECSVNWPGRPAAEP